MAVLGSFELIACEKGTVQDQAAAQAGAHEETDDVFISAGGAEVIFTQHAQVYVVAYIEGHAELLAHGAGHVIVPPGKVRRKEYDAVFLVNDPGSAGSHGVQLFPVDAGFLDHFLHHVDDDLFHIG